MNAAWLSTSAREVQEWPEPHLAAARPLQHTPRGIPHKQPQVRPIHLTPRQREVLSLLCAGLSNKLICRRLDISAGTVKAHIGSILRELGASSRLHAVVLASRYGITDDDVSTT